MAALATAILVQSGHPSRTRLLVGRGLAVAAALVVVAILGEYVTGRAFGLDQWWFSGVTSY